MVAAGVAGCLAGVLSGCAWTEPEPSQTLTVKLSDPHGSSITQAFCRAANDRGVWPFVAPGEVTVPKSTIPLDITCEYDMRTGFVRVLPQSKLWLPTDVATVGGIHEAVDPLRYPATGYPRSIEVVMGETLSVSR